MGVEGAVSLMAVNSCATCLSSSVSKGEEWQTDHFGNPDIYKVRLLMRERSMESDGMTGTPL